MKTFTVPEMTSKGHSRSSGIIILSSMV